MAVEAGSGKDERSADIAGSGTSRRRLLVVGLVVGLGAFLGKLGAVFSSFLRPPVKANAYGGVIRIGALADLPSPGGAPAHIPEGRFWLINDVEGLSALHSSCTHLDCLFTWDTENAVFVCPCHGSEFARDGSLLKGPATRSLDRFPVSLVDGDNTVVRAAGGESAAPVQVEDLLLVDNPADQPEGEETPPQKVLFIEVDTGRKVAGGESSS